MRNEEIFDFLKNCSNLRSIRLLEIRKFSNKGVTSIAQACPKLKIFAADFCTTVDGGAIISFLRICKELEKLSIKDAQNLTDSNVRNIIENGRTIQYLDLSYIEGISVDGLSKSLNSSKSMKQIISLGDLEVQELRKKVLNKDLIICKSNNQLIPIV